MVRDTFLFLYDLFKDNMKRIEKQRQHLPFAVYRKRHACLIKLSIVFGFVALEPCLDRIDQLPTPRLFSIDRVSLGELL